MQICFQNLHNEMSTAFNDGFATSVIDGNSELLDGIQERCLEALDTVQDEELKEKLRPTYKAACKRLVVSLISMMLSSETTLTS
ncbi:MAG: hypothetical protein CM15mP49_25060 [Actinomycetota bacterium]|nr:MAG: hypothetical protein CM15mP49_25060 [Actinomycetota bacterium]